MEALKLLPAIDTGGVMPPILASSLLAAPATFANFITDERIKPYISSDS